MQQKHLNFFADFLLDLGGAVLYSIGIGLFAQNAGFAPAAFPVWRCCSITSGSCRWVWPHF